MMPAMGRCDVTCWLRSITWRRGERRRRGRWLRNKNLLGLLQKMPGLCRAESRGDQLCSHCEVGLQGGLGGCGPTMDPLVDGTTVETMW